ncbi:extracellular calcium-sensing receptor-like [Hemitrygon akajei]|uniref:extracellular calcium-sensing receptor-like n=1 Tax=Hemitrygon akajei TaxID=2704970 RepID=UPI003BF9D3AC
MSLFLALLLLAASPETHGILCQRRTKDDLPDLSKDGDIILGGIFTMHLDLNHDFHSFNFTPKNAICKSCAEVFGFSNTLYRLAIDFQVWDSALMLPKVMTFWLANFRLAQTMIFAIEEINQNDNLLPGITLGYQIYDDCSSTEIASKAALALINGEDKSIEYPKYSGSSKAASIVGCQLSKNSIVTARTIGSFGIPLVSYYSTCSCLSDKIEYPTFFRTIPSDQYQSKILAELVRTFGWTWIGTIRSNTDYGHFGMQEFVQHVETFGVCIAYSESFHRTDPPRKISKIVQVIKQASTKVVVAFVQLLHYIMNVNFTAKTGEVVYFDENGDPVPKYEFVNLQANFKGSVDIVYVGYYDGSAPQGRELVLNVEEIRWNTNGNKIPIAICSEHCLPGRRKVSRKGQPKCCFDCAVCADGEFSNTTDSTDCIKCPPEYWSNEEKTECVLKEVEFLSFREGLAFVLVSLTFVGVCITLATAAIFYRYRETPMVKANNSELSFLLLFALLLCFICLLAFIGKPSGWSCMVRCTAFRIVFVLCISCVLGKTILVVIAFKSTVPKSSAMNWFGPMQQRLGVFAITFLQGLVCVIWLKVSPPYPLKNMSYYRDIIILECDVGSLTAFYLVSAYIALLSVVCLVLAFLARKLPDSFNDAKHITFSMLIFCAVWITFVPAYVSSPGKYTVAVEAFAIWASSFGLLVCIFAPKCYIILLKPEINTKKQMMAKGNFP